MIVPPGVRAPSRSAASIIARQMRSLTLPPGFRFSSFAHTCAPTPSSCGMRERRTTGVEPIRSSGVRATCEASGMGRVAGKRERHDIGGVRKGSIERIVVVFPGALGDLLLALPALRQLRVRHAAANLVLVVNDPLRALAAHAGVADATASLSSADAAGLFGAERLPPWLAGRPFVYSWLGAGSEELRARLTSA